MRRVAAVFLSLVSVYGVAQTTVDQQKLQIMHARLSSIENNVNQIKTTRVVGANVGPQIEQDLSQYASAVLDAYRASMLQMQNASKANQAQQVTTIHNDWESLMQQERTRIDKLVTDMGDIDLKVRDGSIMLSRELIDSLSTPQRREFQRTLKPQVDQKYRQQFPSKFPALPSGMAYMSDDEWRQNAQCSACTLSGPEKSEIAALADKLDLKADPGSADTQWDLIPKAHAAAGIACYATCAASLGTACVVCVASGVSGGVSAYNRMTSCFGSCCRCKWYKPWCCACKPACVVAFLAFLA